MSNSMIPPDALEKLAQRYGLGKYAPKPSSSTSKKKDQTSPTVLSPSGFTITEGTDCFILSPVDYHGHLYQVEWSKQLLDNGNSHTQDQWCRLLKGSEWSLPDGALYYAVLSTLYRERNGSHKDDITKMQRLFRKDFRDHWIMTSTRITYAARGLDTVVHNYKQPDKYAIKARVHGPQDLVTPQSGFEDSIDALLGTRDLAQLEKVSQWASSKKPYLWRLEDHPAKTESRALVFGVGGYGMFDVSANGGSGNCGCALGVVAQKVSSGNGGKP